MEEKQPTKQYLNFSRFTAFALVRNFDTGLHSHCDESSWSRNPRRSRYAVFVPTHKAANILRPINKHKNRNGSSVGTLIGDLYCYSMLEMRRMAFLCSFKSYYSYE